MGKKIKLSKNLFLAFFILITCTAVIYSCKKTREVSITELNTELLNESRTYFESIILKQIALNDNNIRHSIEKTPLWDKAFVKKISVGNAVIVPINYKNDILLRTQDSDNNIIISKTSYLIIFKDKNKSWRAEWVTLIPMANKIKGKFVGIINIEDWNGQFKRGYAIGENGDIKNIYKDESFIFKKINYARTTCLRIDHYSGVGVDGYMQYTYLGSETFCFGGGNGGGNTDNAPDLDNNGGTSGGEPNDYTSMYDCNNDLNGGAIITDCGCIKGNTGISECPRDTTMQSDFYRNLKAMCALNKLMNNNFYRTTLNNFIGTNKPIDLTFRLGNIVQEPGYITLGNTVPNPRTWSSTNIDLTIASNLIDSLPSISVALTLLHEGMHAEIYRKLLSIQGPGNLNAQNFPSLFNIWVKSREWEGLSHEFMANYYVNTLATALRQYDNNKFDIEYYKSYAWSGLKQTNYYNNNLDSAFKANINNKTIELLKDRNKQNCDDL